MKLLSDSKFNLGTVLITLASTFTLAACGGGGGGSDASPTPATPALSDNVLFSAESTPGVIAIINKAGYLRSSNLPTSGQPQTIALGSTPMTGTGASAAGNGWMQTAGKFAQSTIALTLNSDATTYTLKAQSSNGQVVNPKMQLFTGLVTPTPATLTGNYGIDTQHLVTVNGNTFTGLFGYECAWSGSLTSNTKTIDLTQIKFANTQNPTGLACAYAGKEFTGTAFLMGSSQAYPRGVLVIDFDDGGSSVPTLSDLHYFIRP